MALCKYASVLKCTECNSVYFKACPKFTKAHAAYLTRAIRPFRMETQHFTGNVVWSTDEHKAKSAAAQFAMKRNSEVHRLTAQQVIALTMEGADIPGDVFFVDIPSKVFGEAEKIKSVLRSFIEKYSLLGCSIALYINGMTMLQMDEYTRLR